MSTYYIAGFPVSDELYHYGIKGQSWGRRRFQNLDGSLTVLGRQHYDVGVPLDSNRQSSQYQYRLPPQTQSQAQAQSSAQSRYTQQQLAQIQAQRIAQRQRMQAAVEVNDKASVTNAQKNLQNLGYDLKKYGADGKVGDETRSAINAFKRDHGMTQDGKLDLATSKMMEAESKSSLKKGAKGENVARMQDTLKSLGYKLDKYGSDGKFGNETQKALNEFKKAHGLPENGIYDGATRTAMAQELAKKNAPVVPQSQVQSTTAQVQQPLTVQPGNVHTTEVTQDSQVQPEAQTIQPDIDQADNTAIKDKEKKVENKRTKQSGKKKAEQILDTISKTGNQIAEQHRLLSTAISKAAGKTGDALSDAARKVSSAHGSLTSSISSSVGLIKGAAERRAKMYDGILETSRTVSTATLQIQKDVQRASEQLVKQHNKLVSEISDLSKDTRKAIKKTTKQAKKTGKSISSFFNSAKSTLDRGSDALASWFGI